MADPAPSAPAPEAAARAHSAALVACIARAIEAAGGCIPFSRYMELALYAPGLGYYAAAGGAGLDDGADFITAPSVSPLFARCLGRQCAEVLGATGGGDILEPGPGSGTLAAGVLAELEAGDALPERYRLLEVSAELRQRQHETLAREVPHLLERCEWLDAWPEPFSGVVVANEVVDALPVEVFRIAGAGVEQRAVTLRDGALADSWRPAPEWLVREVRRIETDLGWSLPEGYQSELRPTLPAWIRGLADCLLEGAMLLIDYGYVRGEYYLPEREHGTLVCTRAHRAHDDPYDWPGLTDITAFVDFTAVVEAAADAGLELEGFTPQNHFLLSTGLETLAGEAVATDDTRARLFAAQQVKTLTLPGEMGERFNVIGFSRGLATPLAGFAGRDLSRRL